MVVTATGLVTQVLWVANGYFCVTEHSIAKLIPNTWVFKKMIVQRDDQLKMTEPKVAYLMFQNTHYNTLEHVIHANTRHQM